MQLPVPPQDAVAGVPAAGAGAGRRRAVGRSGVQRCHLLPVPGGVRAGPLGYRQAPRCHSASGPGHRRGSARQSRSAGAAAAFFLQKPSAPVPGMCMLYLLVPGRTCGGAHIFFHSRVRPSGLPGRYFAAPGAVPDHCSAALRGAVNGCPGQVGEFITVPPGRFDRCSGACRREVLWSGKRVREPAFFC